MRRAEEDGKLFGSVSEIDIVKYLADNDVVVQKNHVIMDKHIKTTGEYEVKISFTPEIYSVLKVKIEASI
jgi:large subunit ribosomal protein L9